MTDDYQLIRPASFEEWIEAIFDHPATPNSSEDWHWGTEIELEEPASDIGVQYLTRLFEDGGEILAEFSDDQVASGLDYSTTSVGNEIHALMDPSVDAEARVYCLQAMPKLFVSVIAPRVDGMKSYSSMVEPCGKSRLETTCFMWWDACPLLFDESESKLAKACLDAMQDILAIDHMACQRSALHGLGHWKRSHSERVEGIIDAFIANNPEMDPDLLAYAKAARTGRIL